MKERIFKYFKENFHPFAFLRLRNFLMLLLLFTVCIICSTFTTLSIKNFSPKNEVFGIYGITRRIGECLLQDRISETLQNAGYTVLDFRYDEMLEDIFFTKFFYALSTDFLNLLFKPKYNLSVTHYNETIPRFGKKILYVNVPEDMLFEFKNNVLHPKFKDRMQKYDFFADINSIDSAKNDSLLKSIFHEQKIIPTYLVYNATEFQKLDFKSILITGSLWGGSRKSVRTQFALNKLSTDNIIEGVGLEDIKSVIKNYGGNLKSSKELLHKQKECGIGLAMHNIEHLLAGIPTSRGIEVIAASAILIVDQHPFFKKHFGDSVLYFDQFESGNNIYKQIKEHYEWIINNPEEAQKKAKKAHEIFIEKFSLEKALIDLMSAIEN